MHRVKGAKLVERGQHLSAQSQVGTKFECTKLRGEEKIEHTKLKGGKHLSAKKLRLYMLYIHIYILYNNVMSIFYFLAKGGHNFST